MFTRVGERCKMVIGRNMWRDCMEGRGYVGFWGGHETTKMESDGKNRAFSGGGITECYLPHGKLLQLKPRCHLAFRQ